MKLFADMHVHSKFSIDGTSTMEEYCLTAEKTGSRIICFTEHVDFNSMEKNLSIIKDNRTQNFVVDDYFCEINRLRKKYSSLTLLTDKIQYRTIHYLPDMDYTYPNFLDSFTLLRFSCSHSSQ